MTKKPQAPSDIADKFMLRLPEGMRDILKKEAEKSGRSMNAEIVERLQRTFDENKDREDHLAKIIDQNRSLRKALANLSRVKKKPSSIRSSGRNLKLPFK